MTAINDFVSYEAKGTVGVVTVNSPPVNALSQFFARNELVVAILQ